MTDEYQRKVEQIKTELSRFGISYKFSERGILMEDGCSQDARSDEPAIRYIIKDTKPTIFII